MKLKWNYSLVVSFIQRHMLTIFFCWAKNIKYAYQVFSGLQQKIAQIIEVLGKLSHPKHFLKTSFIKLILSRVRSRVYSRLYSQERYQLPVKTNQLAQIIQVGYSGQGCADDDDVVEEDGDACS